jgi:hypothetical protein
MKAKKPNISKIKPIVDYEEEQEETRYSKEYEDKEETSLAEMQDRDMYTEEGIMSRLDDETIDDSEGGFMMGYLAA